MENMALREKFPSKYSIDRKSGCWLWKEACYWNGYGQVRDGKRKALAHRISWEITNGPIPTGLCILHKCDVRNCVNPEHLFVGTSRDNSYDKIKKGKNTIGENNAQAKLTASQVVFIRDSFEKGLLNRKQLALKFSICIRYVGQIISRERWHHV